MNFELLNHLAQIDVLKIQSEQSFKGTEIQSLLCRLLAEQSCKLDATVCAKYYLFALSYQAGVLNYAHQ